MKRALFVAFLVISSIPFASGKETVRFAIGEWEPFYSKGYEHFGLVPHIIHEAFASQGFDVEFGFFPWTRSMALVKAGIWDATCCWSETKERAPFYFFSDQVIDERQVFFHLREYKFDWETIEDLKGLRIGSTPDYYHGHAFNAAEKAGDLYIEKVTFLEQNFDKLLARRIDIYPMDEAAGYATLNNKYPKETVARFTHHPLVLDSMAQRALFSKQVAQSRRLMEVFNQGLKLLIQSGRYQTLQADFKAGRYFPKNKE